MFKTFLIRRNIMSNTSDNLMDTEPGGENTQYTAALLSTTCSGEIDEKLILNE